MWILENTHDNIEIGSVKGKYNRSIRRLFRHLVVTRDAIRIQECHSVKVKHHGNTLGASQPWRRMGNPASQIREKPTGVEFPADQSHPRRQIIHTESAYAAYEGEQVLICFRS